MKVLLVLCVLTAASAKPDLSKCCPENQMYDVKLSCVASSFRESFYLPAQVFDEELVPINRTVQVLLHVTVNVPPCINGTLIPLDGGEFKILINGSIYNMDKERIETEFCVEYDFEQKSVIPLVCYYNVDNSTDPEKSEGIAYIIYTPFLIVSAALLLFTLVIYAIQPKLRDSMHGKVLMCYISCLIVTNVFLCIAYHVFGSEDLRKTTAFIIYFSFLASFFWLNVMCLDIWWTFSGFRPMRGSVKEREHKKFVIYSLYCWGCPLIMLIVAMVMDLHPDIPDTYLKPGFGKRRCWFDEDNATLAYFLGPIAVLIICNILLFVLTAIQIRKLKKDTKILKKQESQRHDDDANNTQRFNLYLKLFLVMGVNWIMEVISWAFGGPEYLWYLTDIGNTLQGVLIFIIFVWKDRIRRLLMEKFCPKRAALNASTKSHGTTLTSTTRASTTRHSPNRNANMSVRSPNDTYRMKPLVASSPSVRSDDSDGP